MLLFPRLGSGGTDGRYNVLISGAPAKIAFQPMSNFVVAGVGIALNQLSRRHNHAGGAEAALKAMLLPEALLDGVQITILRHTFDSDDFAAVTLDRKQGARFYRQSIYRNGAGAAERGLAAAMGTSKEEGIAQEMDEQKPGLDFSGVLISVNGNGDSVFQSKRSLGNRIPSRDQYTRRRGGVFTQSRFDWFRFE
jgi:hypothetical protein